MDARADFVAAVGDTHFKWVGNYQTGAALYAACSSMVSGWKQDVTAWCGAEAPAENPNSYSSIVGGWIEDLTQPANAPRFYYLSAYACQNNDSVHYFDDTESCGEVSNMRTPVPASLKANGPTRLGDRKLRMAASGSETTCFTRNSNGKQYCESVPNARALPAAFVSRRDGKPQGLNKSGTREVSDATADEINAAYRKLRCRGTPGAHRESC
ncbi:hypothetical protein HSX11_24410 [Oxalobacteraceae bacterium]|nr:hypothetical protein [Oxalobacteraceae bacterium]